MRTISNILRELEYKRIFKELENFQEFLKEESISKTLRFSI